MCGRYALGIRASWVRYQMQQQGMHVHDAPGDDEVRETYNFPPGAYGLVYRADVPDSGLREQGEAEQEQEQGGENEVDEPNDHKDNKPKKFDFQLKAMKWGLIPFWTKRSPDYSSMLRTINCRDDSLLENRGMWNTMKQRKRCIVVAQGFFEWLKKGPDGKEKVPHFVKRKDDHLMYFAGLWDCVKFEDTENKLYTYTIITTDSNKQLSFLHDRMPVILEPNTDAMNLWLDPTENKWTKALQSLLKPFQGELDCYPVHTDVGKVGNNSPNFTVPVDSKENKSNIANFFGNVHKQKTSTANKDDSGNEDAEVNESNAPLPKPDRMAEGLKRKLNDDGGTRNPNMILKKVKSPEKKSVLQTSSAKKVRSSTSNQGMTLKTSPAGKGADGSKKITQFFGK